MSATLYLLRQPDSISPSLFRASDTDMDIVFIEHTTLITPSSVKDVVVTAEGMLVGGSHQNTSLLCKCNSDSSLKMFSNRKISS